MMNLHAIVRGAINAVHPDETIILYRSTGQINIDGESKPSYADGVALAAQIQTLSTDELTHDNRTNQAEISRNFYIESAQDNTIKPGSIMRPFAHNGDMIQRVDGTWWLVFSVVEDFHRAGWVKLGAAQQVNPPEGINVNP